MSKKFAGIYLIPLLPVLLLWTAVPLQARTTYLSPTGNDSSPCAPGAEFLTLPAALGCLSAGDTLIVRNGIYLGGVIVQLEGTAGAPVLIRGESLEAIIDTSRNGLDALRLDHSSYVTLDRLTFRHATRAGIGIINCNHITVTDCRCADNGKWGILTGFADDIHFEGNECYGSKDEHGIYHSNSGDRFIIRGNRVHDNSGNGIHLNGDPEIPGEDGVLNWGIVERNIIWGNGQSGGAGINMTHVQDVIVRNNLLYDNYAGGITFYQDSGTFEQGSKRALITGNTVFYLPGQGRTGVNIMPTSEKALICGNIFVSGGGRGALEVNSEHLPSVISDYNIIWGIDTTQIVERTGERRIGLGEWRKMSGNDLHTLFADPLFVNVAAADFHLQPGSPAAGLGLPPGEVRRILSRLGGFDWVLEQLGKLPEVNLDGKPGGSSKVHSAGAYGS